MPSIFESFFADGRAHLQQQHGIAVTWTKADGTVIDVTGALPGPESSDPRDVESGATLHRIRTIEIPLSLVADPNRGDTCTIDGVIWAYDQTLAVQGGMSHVQLVRDEQTELVPRDYRQR